MEYLRNLFRPYISSIYYKIIKIIEINFKVKTNILTKMIA